MRKSFAILVSVLLTVNVLAQVPQKMSYQAVIRDSNNKLITTQNVSMKISILQSTFDGIAIYSETHAPATNENGLISIEVGGGNILSGNFSNINWANGPYFIKTEIDPLNGTNYSITSVSQLLSVPYALAAGNLLLSKNDKLFKTYLTDRGEYFALSIINVEHPFKEIPKVEDIDGNSYGTVKIGDQIWMTENLKTTRLNDTSDIQIVAENINWSNLTTPAFSFYNNYNVDSIISYGALYNYYAIETKKLCPIGWHVPTIDEWNILVDYLGDLAGGRLKETGTEHWNSPNTDALNDSKFCALPGGYRLSDGTYENFRNIGAWWLFEGSGNNAPYHFEIYSSNGKTQNFGEQDEHKNFGFSVRCIKD